MGKRTSRITIIGDDGEAEPELCHPLGELVLAGRYDEAKVGYPRYPQRDVVNLARWMVDEAGRPVPCPDPVHIATAIEVDVLDRVPLGAGAECCDGTCIWFHWHGSRRTRGTRVLHGLGHCGFIVAGWRGHTEVDAWHLQAELALQVEIATEARTLKEAMRIQPHADPWLLRAQLRRARLIDAA